MNRAIKPFLGILLLFILPSVSAQEWNPLPPPEFELEYFLLTETIPELNIDYVLTWTDSAACLMLDPVDAVILHIAEGDSLWDYIIFSDAGMNRLLIWQCLFDINNRRIVKKITVYTGAEIDGLKKPSGMATNAVGRLFIPEVDVIYLCDRGNNRLLEFTFLPDEYGGRLIHNRTLGEAFLEHPIDVAISSYGDEQQEYADLFVIDAGPVNDAGEIFKLNIAGNVEWGSDKIEFPGGSEFNWILRNPIAIACFPDTADNGSAIYLTERTTNSVFRLSCYTNTDPVFTWVHNLERAEKNIRPGGIAFDGFGRIYVANEISQKIELFGPDFEYLYEPYGEPGQFCLPSNLLIDTYHGFCEMLVMEWYGRQSGMQTYLIHNGYSEPKVPSGFVANNLVRKATITNNTMPNTWALGKSYPNPFNADCRIEFDVPRRAHIRLDIFNILGQRVSTLIDDDLEAGSYSTVFRAGPLSSGVYFYSLKSDDFSAARPMLLVK